MQTFTTIECPYLNRHPNKQDDELTDDESAAAAMAAQSSAYDDEETDEDVRMPTGPPAEVSHGTKRRRAVPQKRSRGRPRGRARKRVEDDDGDDDDDDDDDDHDDDEDNDDNHEFATSSRFGRRRAFGGDNGGGVGLDDDDDMGEYAESGDDDGVNGSDEDQYEEDDYYDEFEDEDADEDEDGGDPESVMRRRHAHLLAYAQQPSTLSPEQILASLSSLPANDAHAPVLASLSISRAHALHAMFYHVSHADERALSVRVAMPLRRFRSLAASSLDPNGPPILPPLPPMRSRVLLQSSSAPSGGFVGSGGAGGARKSRMLASDFEEFSGGIDVVASNRRRASAFATPEEAELALEQSRVKRAEAARRRKERSDRQQENEKRDTIQKLLHVTKKEARTKDKSVSHTAAPRDDLVSHTFRFVPSSSTSPSSSSSAELSVGARLVELVHAEPAPADASRPVILSLLRLPGTVPIAGLVTAAGFATRSALAPPVYPRAIQCARPECPHARRFVDASTRLPACSLACVRILQCVATHSAPHEWHGSSGAPNPTSVFTHASGEAAKIAALRSSAAFTSSIASPWQ